MNKLKKKNKIAAVIPFYNEYLTIRRVIGETLNYVDMVFAVNDGSTDDSINQIDSAENLKIINIKTNKGKGFALREGFKMALENDCDIIVTLDGDLQHLPQEIPGVLTKIDDYDIVIGNRLNNLKKMPLQRIMSNKLTSFLISKKTGQQILDCQSGFRAYKADVLKKISTKQNGFEAETEIIIEASKLNFKIGFSDISTIYNGQKSKMSPFKTTIGFIKLLFS